jgi:hypothetical protein
MTLTMLHQALKKSNFYFGILVFIVPVGIYSNVYISTKPSHSQQYMFIIIYRLKTEHLVSAAFGHHQAQIQELVLAETVHE